MTSLGHHSGCPRVAHLVVSLAHGGLERLVVDWTNARNRRRPGSTVIVCLDEPGDLAAQVEGGAVVCLHADRSRSPWDRSTVAALRAWVRSRRTEDGGRRADELFRHEPLTINQLPPPSVLHAHNLAAWQYAVLSARGTGARVVYTQHGANLHNQRFINRLRSRMLALLTDELVAVSTPTARAMGRSLWIPRSGIRVVANGVAGGGWRVEGGGEDRRAEGLVGAAPILADGEAGLSEGAEQGKPPVIGSVGRLAHVKGYDRLIRAVGTLIRSQKSEVRSQPSTLDPRLPAAARSTQDGFPPVPRRPLPPVHCSLLTVNLLLVGDGPERENLGRLAAELGVADRVRFAGFQSDPRPWLAALDLFVLPSRSEGLSMGLLEAMAAGVPVAVTDVGANREVIEDGVCGLLLPDDDALWPEVFAAALADRAGLRARAGKARERVATRYSMKATLDEYERIYRRLMSGGRGGCGDDCACGKGQPAC